MVLQAINLSSRTLFCLLLAMVTFIGACHRDNRRQVKGVAPAIEDAHGPGGQSPNPGGNGKFQGTTDGGGGNGVLGQPFESYIVDPTQLRGFKEYIQPIIDNLNKSEKAEESSENDSMNDLGIWLKLKRWYLIPLNMSCVDKDTLGVSFAGNGVEQLACQDREEIWIDSKKTDNTNDREFARLILHEIVMQLYLLRFEKFSDILRRFKQVDPKAKIDFADGELNHMDVVLKAEPRRPLNRQDYFAIRRVTDILFERGRTMTWREFDDLLRYNNFDKRFLDNEQSTVPEGFDSIKEMPLADFLKLLTVEESLGRKVDVCRTPTGEKIADCEAQFEIVDEYPMKKLKIALRAGGQTKVFAAHTPDKVTISSARDLNRDYFMVTFAELDFKHEKKIGDRQSMIIFEFNPSPNFNKARDPSLRLNFAGVFIFQNVVAKVEIKKPEGSTWDFVKGRITDQERCLYLRPSTAHSDPWQNQIVAVSRTVDHLGISPIVFADFTGEPTCMGITTQ